MSDGSAGFPMGEIHEAESIDEHTERPESLKYNSQSGDYLHEKAGDIVTTSAHHGDHL